MFNRLFLLIYFLNIYGMKNNLKFWLSYLFELVILIALFIVIVFDFILEMI